MPFRILNEAIDFFANLEVGACPVIFASVKTTVSVNRLSSRFLPTPDETTTFFNEYNSMVSAMLGEDEKVQIFKPVRNGTVIHTDCESSGGAAQTTYTALDSSSGEIEFIYRATYTGNYYFYSPVLSPTEVKIAFNDGEDVKYLGSDSNHILSAGYYHEGDEIRVVVTLPANKSITFRRNLNFLWYLDEEAYGNAMQTLLDGPQFNIDKESEDHHLTGSISTSKENQTIFTTIPYDEGWKVYVDGEQVEIYECVDALMAFDIDSAGEHTLEMKYMPDCYKLGIAISAISLMIFIAICAVDLLLKKTLLKDKTPVYESEYWALEDLEEELPLLEEGEKGNDDNS